VAQIVKPQALKASGFANDSPKPLQISARRAVNCHGDDVRIVGDTR
jgi:hypothetical protein